MATPHNAAGKGEIAETVIMAGDPLRIKFMADNYLQDITLFNSVRNMLGYTGTYRGQKVSVMGHGIGIPSIGLYSHELFAHYDVQRIIRAGSAGGMQEFLEVGDLVLAQGACTNSSYLRQFELPGDYAPIADFGLLSKAVESCKAFGYKYYVGNILATDYYYDESQGWKKWTKMGVLASEMESSALYANAARFGRSALSILTISDNMVTGADTDAHVRQTAFTKMMDVAFSLV